MNAYMLAIKQDPASLQMALAEVSITIAGYFYAVDFGDGVHPRHHRVGKNGICSCYLEEQCPAVDIVRAHLEAGGERAPEPPPGYYPVYPAKCPVCGAKCVADSSLNSRTRGAGWRCTQGGKGHYWKRMGQHLAQKFKNNPWLFPPIVVRDGRQVNAYDGILPGDQALYPGVLRAECT